MQQCRDEWHSWPDNYICLESGESLYAVAKCSAGNLDFSEFLNDSQSNLVYYIIGFVIILIILFLILKKK